MYVRWTKRGNLMRSIQVNGVQFFFLLFFSSLFAKIIMILRNMLMKSKNKSTECQRKSSSPFLRFSMINCVSYKMKPQNRRRPPYKWSWYSICDWKKMFINPRKQSVVTHDNKVPPKYRKLLSSAHKALNEKQTKIKVVAKKAVVIMLGLIWMTRASKGPIDKPVHPVKPTGNLNVSIDSLVR